MSATATKSATKTEAKSKPKSKTKTKKPSAAKIEANRRNSQKSKGPTTDAGKARSRYNALKHGMTAKTVLLPGDDPQEFAGRLRYLQDDLQARNSLEAVVIERLAGDLWKSDRSDQSFCNRIKLRLRHGPVDQSLKDADEAVELGQHLLWMPEFPLPVGALEGEAKGALAKFPFADVPGDPHHPARLLLKLQATVAGCDWLLTRWGELQFRLEQGGPWAMDDVWKMVRLLGKTAIEMKDDFQVALLVLASLALEPAAAPEAARKATVAEAMSAMSRDHRLTRVLEGITRLCEPFQQALARMPLEKLAPENAVQARQRLSAVVEEELGRIGRLRAKLQQIADADLAEAPVRLAFETGTEGDRQRRYVLSFERLINRRIDTFLKVRKASGSGELDLIELQQSMGGADKLTELLEDAGFINRPDPVLKSTNTATTAAVVESESNEELPSVSVVSEVVCGDESILRNEATAPSNDMVGSSQLRDEEAPGCEAEAPDTLCTSQLDRGDPPSEESQCDDLAQSRPNAPAAPLNGIAPSGERESSVSESTNASTAPAAAQSLTDGEPPSVSFLLESACGDNWILRNEPSAAADEPRDIENESPARLAASVEGDEKVRLDEPQAESGPKEIREPVAAADLVDTRGDPVPVPPAESPAPAVAPSAGVPTAVPRPWRTLTPEQLVHNQRVARYRAMKGLPPN